MMPPEIVCAVPFPANEHNPASAARSNLPTVRNPMLALQEVRDAASLPVESREALRVMLVAVSKACRQKGDEAWRKRKPPMAAYWKSNAVHARHLAHALAVIAAQDSKQCNEPPDSAKETTK